MSAVEASEIKAQSGNPAFLEQAYHGIQLAAKITGTEAPKKQSVEAEFQLSMVAERLVAARKRLAASKQGHSLADASVPAAARS